MRPIVADRLIRVTTAVAVAAVAAVAAVISYRHAYELVTAHGETGLTTRLLPFTVDGLIPPRHRQHQVRQFTPALLAHWLTASSRYIRVGRDHWLAEHAY